MSDREPSENQRYTESVRTRLTPEMNSQFETWRRDNELDSAEALRQLVSTGLEASRDDRDVVEASSTLKRGTVHRVSFVAAVLFVFVEFVGPGELGPAVGGFFILFMLTWSMWPTLAAVRDR